MRMNDALRHRGPDGEGSWVSKSRKVGLGHTRLAIVDLDPTANQPMTNEDRSIWLSYNGEIYNAAKLRRELIAAGHRFASDHCDSEVLVHGYEQWGIDQLLHRIDGIYAFALHDVPRRATFLVRDNVGVKPLYLTVDGDTLLFASEIKALLAVSTASPQLSVSATYHYLSFLAAPAPLTMFKDTFKLPPATYLKIVDGHITTTRYWTPLNPSEPVSYSDWNQTDFIEHTARLFEESVRSQTVADVKIGAFLSGGVDSSSIVSIMSTLTEQPVNTFTVGFDDYSHLNELDEARKIADHYKTNHHVSIINEARMKTYVDSLSYDQDEPIADWVCIPLHFISQSAKEHGVKVVLVGEGADELFCGYAGYIASIERLSKHWRPFHKLPKGLQKIAAQIAISLLGHHPRGAVYADNIYRAAYEREHFWTGATMFWETDKALLLNNAALCQDSPPEALINAGLIPEGLLKLDSYAVIQEQLTPFEHTTGQYDILTQMTYRDLNLRLAELLLMRVDKITMASSIEARVPFLDRELVELALQIPLQDKIPNGRSKHVFKSAAARWIPRETIDRPKTGFGAPMSDWLKGSFGEHVRERILDSSITHTSMFRRDHIERLIKLHRQDKGDYAQHIWTLFNLAQWSDQWNVKAH